MGFEIPIQKRKRKKRGIKGNFKDKKYIVYSVHKVLNKNNQCYIKDHPMRSYEACWC